MNQNQKLQKENARRESIEKSYNIDASGEKCPDANKYANIINAE